ncbi:MAG: chromosome segregation protein SMC [Acidimicrobiales bacterium]|nr:chromosome segregation protein SMC [Acidimicrobiales bacterium]
MFLKALTLKGFKSFADATTLELEPGVTVVVGPNGSGKSNVVDAIAWVLGAQAPSLVRSQKMDDVIFAGTDKRPALGRAEVSLTIDNTAKMLPIDFTEVTISRTLFRTGESEYAINGVGCRLLDIQELLSDAGVGRQQHVIVSQGHIDEVLNSRPEDRRAIIEEAAGVLKFRRRKEKAERRLNATEANLTRVQDLLREVRRQLRPLEKQADAARRHGSLVSELQQLRLYAAGRELTQLKDRRRDAADKKAALAQQQNDIKGELARLDTAVLGAEATLTAQGGDDLGDSLVRYEALREKARGLAALLTERQRGIERDRSAFVDQAVVASLEAEHARVRAELDRVATDEASLAPEAAALHEAELALLAERNQFEAEWADGVAPPSGQAAEMRGELGALRASIERSEREASQLAGKVTGLNESNEMLTSGRDTHVSAIQTGEAAEASLVAGVDEAEAAELAAERDHASAVEAVTTAERELNAGQARVEALALALDEAQTRAGVERLAELDGVLGTLLDLISVDAGYESAFEAAAGDALSSVVVDGVWSANAALQALRDGELTGSILTLGLDAGPVAPPPVGDAVRNHVRAANPEVESLLDRLLGDAVVVDDWQQAVDTALAHPGAVVVTPGGDRFGRTGWRVGQAGSGATGAALAEAEAAVVAATATLEQARAAEQSAATAHTQAIQMHAGRSGQLDRNDEVMQRAAEALARLDAQARDLAVEREALEARQVELADRRDRESARVAELEAQLPQLEADEDESMARARLMGEMRAEIEERAASVGARRTDIEVRTAGIAERRQGLERRLTELEERLERNAAEREAVEAKRVALDRKEGLTQRLAVVVDQRLTVIESELSVLRARRQKQSEAAQAIATELDGLRRERGAAERRYAELRELASRADVEEAEVRMRLEAAVETTRRELDTEPHGAMKALCPELPPGTTAPARIRELERELKIMGPINPLALEEYDELQERHEFLQGQLDDIKSSRRDLSKVIKAIDEEIVNVFASAFADVADNFEQLFDSLFPGGRGRLKLTDPENLLGTGLEIEAKPSGKNVKKLSLLSGGERTLTAMAFLFAVFRSRPSPFYVMDEVEAALDDVNLHRFLGLVQEFRNEAQLLIVSHQKRTMEAGDCLYGITMQPGGSSRAVSEKVGASERTPVTA